MEGWICGCSSVCWCELLIMGACGSPSICWNGWCGLLITWCACGCGDVGVAGADPDRNLARRSLSLSLPPHSGGMAAAEHGPAPLPAWHAWPPWSGEAGPAATPAPAALPGSESEGRKATPAPTPWLSLLLQPVKRAAEVAPRSPARPLMIQERGSPPLPPRASTAVHNCTSVAVSISVHNWCCNNNDAVTMVFGKGLASNELVDTRGGAGNSAREIAPTAQCDDRSGTELEAIDKKL